MELCADIAQQTSGNKKSEDDANKETEEKVNEIKSIGEKEGDKVVESLLRAVTDVNPQPPEKSA